MDLNKSISSNSFLDLSHLKPDPVVQDYIFRLLRAYMPQTWENQKSNDDCLVPIPAPGTPECRLGEHLSLTATPNIIGHRDFTGHWTEEERAEDEAVRKAQLELVYKKVNQWRLEAGCLPNKRPIEKEPATAPAIPTITLRHGAVNHTVPLDKKSWIACDMVAPILRSNLARPFQLYLVLRKVGSHRKGFLYFDNHLVDQLSSLFGVSPRTIRRWYGRALDAQFFTSSPSRKGEKVHVKSLLDVRRQLLPNFDPHSPIWRGALSWDAVFSRKQFFNATLMEIGNSLLVKSINSRRACAAIAKKGNQHVNTVRSCFKRNKQKTNNGSRGYLSSTIMEDAYAFSNSHIHKLKMEGTDAWYLNQFCKKFDELEMRASLRDLEKHGFFHPAHNPKSLYVVMNGQVRKRTTDLRVGAIPIRRSAFWENKIRLDELKANPVKPSFWSLVKNPVLSPYTYKHLGIAFT